MLPRIQIRLKEWDVAQPARGSVLQGVFVSDQPGAVRSVEALRAGPMLEVDELRSGTRIRAFAFVGRVAIGNVEVTIEPKVPRTPLMALLRYACGATQLSRLSVAQFTTEADSFQDLLVELLIDESERLISSGLLRRYSRRMEWLSSPRGRIDMTAFSRAPETRIKLPCTHFPRVADWIPNQLLYAGLRLGAVLAMRLELRIAARRLASMMSDDISSVPLDRTTMDEWNRVRNRQTRGYETAVELIRLLASGAGISLSGETPSLEIDGFLFDMNRFFQTVLSRFLKEHLTGYEIEVEHRLRGIMAYVRGQNPRNRPNPVPRPDLAILHRGRAVRFLDAKYRDLWTKPLPAHMLYQLAVYAVAGGGDCTSVILYPTTDPASKDAVIAVRHPVQGGTMAQVSLRPVNLIDLARLIGDADLQACRREAVRWTGLEP